MDIQVVEKGMTLAIADKATGAAYEKLYVGAGWDQDAGRAVDLDLVAAALSGGKLTAQTRLVYFGDKTEPGITLGADNTTGAGDGDDESITIDFSKVEADVDSIALGVVAYSGADLSTAKNFKFRIVNGTKASDTQVMEVNVAAAKTGDTILHAATLKRTGNGWSIENVGSFYQRGSGSDAVKGFANLFTGNAAQAAA